MVQSSTRSGRLDAGIIFALLVALVVRPTLYAVIVPVHFNGMIESYVSQIYLLVVVLHMDSVLGRGALRSFVVEEVDPIV